MTQSLDDLHRKFAVDCFNGTWDLLDNPNRTPEEDLNMIHLAHASRYHWGVIGSPLEFARGDWQISRVYAVLGMGEMSYKFADSTLNRCLQHGIGDFDLAFAYEAILRSCVVLGDTVIFDKYEKLAVEAGKAIEKEDDRKYFFRELGTIPGISFG